MNEIKMKIDELVGRLDGVANLGKASERLELVSYVSKELRRLSASIKTPEKKDGVWHESMITKHDYGPFFNG